MGAVLRYLISGWVYNWSGGDFPLGTLAVNMLGSFLLGLSLGLADQWVIHPQIMLFVTIGVLGAFTTFSTFSFETWALIEIGSYGRALLNVGISLMVGLLAVFLGLLAGRVIGVA